MDRPSSGWAHYLRDLIYGSSDGVVTTMAVVAGVEGASLSTRVAMILGVANLLADGFSMGASNYLGLKSELEQTGSSVAAEKPLRHGLATFAAFVVAGSVPLGAFLLPAQSKLPLAAALSALVLTIAGAARSRFIHRSSWICAAEMLGVGGVATAVAYAVGVTAQMFAR